MKLTSPHSFRLLTLIGLLSALFTGLLLGSYIRKVQATCYTPNHLSSTTPRWTPTTAITVIFDENSGALPHLRVTALMAGHQP